MPVGRPSAARARAFGAWRRVLALWLARAFAVAAPGLLPAAPSALAAGPEAPVHSLQLVQAAGEPAHINVAPAIVSEPAARTPLHIEISRPEALPKNSFVRLRGLPPAVSLSDGHAIAPGAWAVPLVALPALHMNVPTGVSGRTEITVSLVAEDGALLAEVHTAIIVAPAPLGAPSAQKRAASPLQNANPARPTRPPMSPADREAAERMVARGERDLQEGNVAMARQFFLRAAEAGLARGALLLAATYDPRELARMHAQGVQPNLDQARTWYERARDLGAPEAEERLARLGAG